MCVFVYVRVSVVFGVCVSVRRLVTGAREFGLDAVRSAEGADLVQRGVAHPHGAQQPVVETHLQR
jgi:hypothetical protein